MFLTRCRNSPADLLRLDALHSRLASFVDMRSDVKDVKQQHTRFVGHQGHVSRSSHIWLQRNSKDASQNVRQAKGSELKA